MVPERAGMGVSGDAQAFGVSGAEHKHAVERAGVCHRAGEWKRAGAREREKRWGHERDSETARMASEGPRGGRGRAPGVHMGKRRRGHGHGVSKGADANTSRQAQVRTSAAGAGATVTTTTTARRPVDMGAGERRVVHLRACEGQWGQAEARQAN
ncbi:hypothetical protein FRC10_006146, partial [Ceratobasidium sp. 414]